MIEMHNIYPGSSKCLKYLVLCLGEMIMLFYQELQIQRRPVGPYQSFFQGMHIFSQGKKEIY